MKILMVCLGNICRSPLAEGILRKKTGMENTRIDSAGTGGWHAGEHPDKRAIETGKQFGVDISKLVARQFSVHDFDEFDRIFVMDRDNLRDVLSLARHDDDKRKVDLLLNADQPGSNRSVPDPYYGGDDGFVRVFKMIDEACTAIVKQIHQNS
ncbi:MAG: low molecular weight phosphotyrosine protein phosphatase [Bacteroidetes bacterium]|nr:low molecular weight phosphotyrosine protein phosphatase [Bacteroidota bacterium]